MGKQWSRTRTGEDGSACEEKTYGAERRGGSGALQPARSDWQTTAPQLGVPKEVSVQVSVACGHRGTSGQGRTGHL